PASLRGQALGEVVQMPGRTPGRLLAHYRRWAAHPGHLRAASPTLAFAVLGQARASGLLTPEKENRLLGNLITYWALRSTLDVNAAMARLPLAASVTVPLGTAGPVWRARAAVPAGPPAIPPGGGHPAIPPRGGYPAIRRGGGYPAIGPAIGRAGSPGGRYQPGTQAARTGPPVVPRRTRAPVLPARPRAQGTRARAPA